MEETKGNGAVIRLLTTSQGDENHILPTGLFDPARRNQPPGIGQQHHLQEDFRIIRGPTVSSLRYLPSKIAISNRFSTRVCMANSKVPGINWSSKETGKRTLGR
jgi:hypothetical protein